MWLKLAALILSLSLDTLVVSISLGALGLARSAWPIVATFAAFEAGMPIVGLVTGHALLPWLGARAERLGPALLIAVGLYMLGEPVLEWVAEGRRRPAVPPVPVSNTETRRRLVGWSLIAAALSVSVDELAVGLSLGVLNLPVVLTTVLIAGQAVLASVIGLQVGTRLKRRLGETAEIPAALVLTGLGLFLLLNP